MPGGSLQERAIGRRVYGVPLPVAAVFFAVAGLAALALLAAEAPIAWLWLALCALLTVPVVVWFGVHGRLFEPLPLVAASCALLFVLRPLQLALGWRDLFSHYFPKDPVRRLSLLEGQEIALYVGERLQEPLDAALARAIGACALFVVFLLIGYRVGAGRWLSRRFQAIRDTTTAINVPAAVGLSLAVGLAAQVAIIARAGGPGSALESASDQTALSDSFVLFFLAGFSFAGVLIWLAWRRPRTRWELAGLVLSVVAVCAFSLSAGSRARVFISLMALAVAIHYLRRRWRTRELVGAGIVMLAFASSFVVFREVADEGTLRQAATSAAEHVLDEGVILNDITSFDHVLYVTSIYGESRPYEDGRFLVNGARSFVPSALDPAKPEGGDIVLRKVVWKDEFGAGRPPTVVGDLYIDFSWLGVAFGGLLVGVACRSLLGLVRGGQQGREYRVALFALLLVVLYELVVGTFSIALGFSITLILPFLVAVHVFGRLPRRPRSAADPAR